MTKNVLIEISALHNTGEQDSIQTVYAGTYAYIQNKHIIRYEEILEESLTGEPAAVQCILKVAPDSVTLSKKGHTHTEMHFKKGEPYETLYNTPLGSLQMRVDTSNLEITEAEDAISLKMDYRLDMNYCHASNCSMEIVITSQQHPETNQNT